MTQQSRAVFKTFKDTQFADNTTEAITEETERDVHENIADSVPFLTDTNTFTSASVNIFNGHVRVGVVRSGAATATLATETLHVITGSSGTDRTLPSSLITGKIYHIKNEGTVSVDINQGGGSSQLFTDSVQTAISLAAGKEMRIWCDGTYWQVELAPDTQTSGTYSPTGSNLINVASSTIRDAFYTRIGDIVTVFFQIDITPTAGATNTQYELDLPVSSSFSNSYDLVGSATFVQATLQYSPVDISAKVADDEMFLQFTPTNTNAGTVRGSFSYEVN